ncbi:hypothetical protein GTY83_37130 [Streptomyces sp. SID4928]|nr:hypothetical protein [Streptomyces sp. ACT-1]MYR47534.1 hypothetical protein [Streptomyces sp. SID4928]MYR54683.1 hypothetical protein [Streptomyces sp. SID4928]
MIFLLRSDLPAFDLATAHTPVLSVVRYRAIVDLGGDALAPRSLVRAGLYSGGYGGGHDLAVMTGVTTTAVQDQGQVAAVTARFVSDT